MDADDHVNTQLFIITVIKRKLSDYSNVILEVHMFLYYYEVSLHIWNGVT